MISQTVLDMIADTSVTQTYDIVVSLDTEKTSDTPGLYGGLFRPKTLRMLWTRRNGDRWQLVSVQLSGPRITQSNALSEHADGLVGWRSLEDVRERQIPPEIFEIVQETKPKE